MCRPPLAAPEGPGHAGHLVPASQLADLCVPLGDDGVVIGQDAAGTPQLLGLQRPAPYTVVLVGGLWTAQILALRAAATGIRVAVETGRAPAWSAVAGAGAQGPHPITLHRVGDLPPLDAAPATPALVVRDCGVQPPRSPAAAPWQSVLTLLPHLGPAAPRLLRTAALVGLQRLSPEEAEQAAPALGLTGQERALLPGLPGGVTLWCAGADHRRIATTVTDAETGLLGNPRRID
ncbi:hypothetical protein [Streptomyces sp. YIM 130001]|uniref:hypothetical protein n=1 Tax=Streptomyces sp. YIM 130001 TaxID=2259644 RepID=UPI000E659951|nr:hypothetical protein [Streptomyces sp. YIM 130001]